MKIPVFFFATKWNDDGEMKEFSDNSRIVVYIFLHPDDSADHWRGGRRKGGMAHWRKLILSDTKKGTSKSRIRSNVWRQCVYKVTGNLSYDVNVKVALPILFPTLFIVRWLTGLFFSGSHISFYCYYQPIIRELQKRSIGLHIVDGRMTAEIVQVRRTEKRERDWSICDIRKASTFSSSRLFFCLFLVCASLKSFTVGAVVLLLLSHRHLLCNFSLTPFVSPLRCFVLEFSHEAKCWMGGEWGKILIF